MRDLLRFWSIRDYIGGLHYNFGQFVSNLRAFLYIYGQFRLHLRALLHFWSIRVTFEGVITFVASTKGAHVNMSRNPEMSQIFSYQILLLGFNLW